MATVAGTGVPSLETLLGTILDELPPDAVAALAGMRARDEAELLKAVLTGLFKRDVEKARRSGRDVSKLAALMTAIAEGRRLEPAREDHPLRGEWKGCRDCHVEGDWVLIYETTESEAIFRDSSLNSTEGSAQVFT